MGDIANMTDCDGRVNGPRLLRWLRSKAGMYGEAEATAREMSEPVIVAWNSGMRHLLEEMADDLERELTPPDYPGDDGDEPERYCPNCRGTGFVDGTGPDIGRNQIACQGCDGTGRDFTADCDGVDLDDTTFLGRPEQE